MLLSRHLSPIHVIDGIKITNIKKKIEVLAVNTYSFLHLSTTLLSSGQ